MLTFLTIEKTFCSELKLIESLFCLTIQTFLPLTILQGKKRHKYIYFLFHNRNWSQDLCHITSISL